MSSRCVVGALCLFAVGLVSAPAGAQVQPFDVEVVVHQPWLLFAQVPPAPPAPPAPPSPGFGIVIGASGSFLGVGVRDVDAERAKELKLKEERGVEVTSVEDESPAEKAGLKKGDVVLEFNGQRVEGTEQFVRLVRETPPGRQVKLSVWRGGASQTITATIATRQKRVRVGREFNWENFPRPEVWIPDMPRPNMSWRSQMLGVEAEALEGQLAQYFGVKSGVLVRAVVKDSAAEKAGIKAGDVITKVDQTSVDSPRELSQAIRSRDKKTYALTLVRDRKETTLNVTVEQESSETLRPRPRRVNRPEEREF